MTLVAPRKTPPTNKKRSGKHQHGHKHFAKTYWPYLPLLLVVVVGLACSSLWPASNSVLGVNSDLSPGSLLAQTNSERDSHSEPYLTMNSVLDKAAQKKAEDMVARNYWSHNTPDGQTPWSFITGAGYSYQKAGENLAYGFSSATNTMTAWMNSPEHRANILNDSYSQVGFGLASAPNFNGDGPTTVIVAMYASPAAGNKVATSPVQTGPTNNPTKSLDSVSQSVARIQLLPGGQTQWSLLALSAMASLAVIFVLIRHGRYWHRTLVKSEVFVIHHPFLDISVALLGTAAFVLSQAAGFIQ